MNCLKLLRHADGDNMISCNKFEKIVTESDKYYARTRYMPDENERLSDIAGGIADELGIDKEYVEIKDVRKLFNTCHSKQKKRK